MPDRKTPIHLAPLAANNRSIIIFVTVGSAQRKPIFAKPDAAKLFVECWHTADRWAVGRYVVMPDHLHFFSAPNDAVTTLEVWLKYWKTLVSRRWPRPDEQPIWHPDHWDRQLRRGDSYENKWEYVRQNPVRHGLVTRTEDWPYQGVVEVLEWHDA